MEIKADPPAERMFTLTLSENEMKALYLYADRFDDDDDGEPCDDELYAASVRLITQFRKVGITNHTMSDDAAKKVFK